MDLRVPDYYCAFQCTGSACPDCCCIGWEIDVDEEAMARYAAAPGPFGETLRAGIEPGEPPHFRLAAGERCPFLNAQNLCTIILNLGEDWLCRICDRHPRFIDRWADRVEMGLTLACPAACDLILGRETPLRLVPGPADEARRWADFLAEPDDTDPEALALLLQVRARALTLAADTRLPLPQRCANLLLLAAQVQDELDFGDGDSARDAAADFEPCSFAPAADPAGARAILALFRELEALDDSWSQALDRLNPGRGGLTETQTVRLLEYFLFRYLLPAARDLDLYGPMGFCLLSVWVIDRLAAVMPPAEAARLYSKTVEYSDESPARVMEAVNDGAPLDYEALLALLAAW